MHILKVACKEIFKPRALFKLNEDNLLEIDSISGFSSSSGSNFIDKNLTDRNGTQDGRSNRLTIRNVNIRILDSSANVNEYHNTKGHKGSN